MSNKLEKFKILCLSHNHDFLNDSIEAFKKKGFELISTQDPHEAYLCLVQDHRDLAVVMTEPTLGRNLNSLIIEQSTDTSHLEQIPYIVFGNSSDQDLKTSLPKWLNVIITSIPNNEVELLSILTDNSRQRIENIREQRILEESFLNESQELLEELEPLLLQLEERPQDLKNVASIFRIIHTIKGASGVLSIADFTAFLHKFEDILTQIKDGKRIASPSTITALLSAYDTLGKTIAGFRTEHRVVTDLTNATKNLEELDQERHDDLTKTNSVSEPSEPTEQQGQKRESVAVPKQMLDEFLHLTGETTVIRNMVNKLVRSIERQIPGDEDVELLVDLLDEMHKINATMQTKTAELRKTPMRQVIKKLPRTVRDISNQLNKKVRINITGEDLRVDTAIAQALSNSLIHMIRNAVDHGIELPEIRKRAGKNPEGTITLTCREIRDCVVVEVSDDGAGIDPEKIRKKLREQGRLEASVIDTMERDRLLRQIFEPGFSTASSVTNVSGRGVGMDMVQTSIDQLKGRIDVNSEIGHGTSFKFTIPIPKSVVIINALIVGTCGQTFAIPQDNIVRLLRVPHERRSQEISKLPGSHAIRLNDMLIPLVSLHEALNLGSSPIQTRDSDELNIVIAKWEGGTYGLIVDSIQDAEDIVVKSLHSAVERIGAYGGSTFLGDGSVALIIDVGGIAKITGQAELQARNHQIGTSKSAILPSDALRIVGHDYMLFEPGYAGVFAIPVENVFRIEEIANNAIVPVGERRMIHYRDDLIPIIELAQALKIPPLKSTEHAHPEKTHTLIISFENKLFATPIARVLEVTRIEAEMKKPSPPTKCIKGLFTIEERVITVIDVHEAIQSSGVDSHPINHTSFTNKTEKNLDDHPPTQTYKQAAGWGIF